MKPFLFIAALLLAAPAAAWAQDTSATEHTAPGESATEHPSSVGETPAAGEQPAAEHGAAAPEHAAAGEHAAGAHGHGLAADADCATVLSQPEEAVEEHPAVADVIFHHVSDGHVIEFESPFSHNKATIDFKKGVCRAFGWNGIVHIGNSAIDLTPTKHLFFMWIAAVLLILVFWRATPKKGQIVPKGIGVMLEMIVVFIRDEIARKNIPGKEADRYTPYLLTCFFFIFTMNLLGLLPYSGTATANIGVTLGLALLTFILTQYAGVRAAGIGGYFKHLTGGVHPALWPIMIPVEVLGLFTKPFALTIRLFANMVAGHIVIFFLLGLIFILGSVALAPVSVAFAFAIYLLEIFVALVQAYVFTILSALFIGFGVAMGHHEHEETPSGAHKGEHAEHVAHH